MQSSLSTSRMPRLLLSANSQSIQFIPRAASLPRAAAALTAFTPRPTLLQRNHRNCWSSTTQSRTMAELKKIFTADAPAPLGPYSQAVSFGNLLFVSGQIPFDAQGNAIEGTIAEKTDLVIKNLIAVLKAGGSDISKVVKSTVFLDDMGNFAEVNSVYEKYFTHKPARSCVAVKTLPKGVPVEIEVIAVAGNQ